MGRQTCQQRLLRCSLSSPHTLSAVLRLYPTQLPLRFWVQGGSSVPAGSINGRRKSDELFKPEGWEGGAAVSDWEPFRQLGRSMIDYITDYYQNVEDHPVRAMVKPGYLKVHFSIVFVRSRL